MTVKKLASRLWSVMKWFAMTFAVLAILVLAVCVLYPLVTLTNAYIGIWKERSFIQRAENYEPAAQLLALYCQSDPQLTSGGIDSCWLPDVLSQMPCAEGEISPAGAKVDFGHGISHQPFSFGYEMTMDKASSSSENNTWQLYYFSENSPKRLLTTVTIPGTAKLSAEEIAKKVSAGFDAHMAANPEEERWIHRSKVLWLYYFGQEQAASAECEAWGTMQPDYWFPRFAQAHIRCRQGDADRAANDFISWVEEHPAFHHCVYLGLFHVREGQLEPAVAAVRRCVEQPFEEPPTIGANKFALGYNAAVIAYLGQDYALCSDLCDKVLADPRKEESWRHDLLRLRAAALAMQDKYEEAQEAIRACLQIQHYRGADSAQGLQKAIRSRDRDFIARFRNWKHQDETFYDPLESPFLSMRVPAREHPSLYPPDWQQRLGI